MGEKTGKFRQEKLLFLQFMQCRLYNDCFLRFSYSASIHFKVMLQNYGKTAFFISGTLGWNGSNTFQRKLNTTKDGFFLSKLDRSNDVAEIIISSCNNFPISPFLSFKSALFILRLTCYTSKIRSKLLNKQKQSSGVL